MKLHMYFIFGTQNSIYNIFKRVCFLIGVVTTYETDFGKGTGPK